MNQEVLLKEDIFFYNTDNNRPDDTVNHELAAMLEPNFYTNRPPIGVFGVEGTGLHVKTRHGFRLIRDTSTKSRANIFGYIRDDVPFEFIRWMDFHGSWPRTQGPGIHEPRSFPVFKMFDFKTIIVHLPPDNAENAYALQMRCIKALANARPNIAIGDFNERKDGTGPGPSMLARRIEGGVWGDKIDCAVTRRVRVQKLDYHTRWNNVEMKSDHGHCARMRILVPYEKKLQVA